MDGGRCVNHLKGRLIACSEPLLVNLKEVLDAYLFSKHDSISMCVFVMM